METVYEIMHELKKVDIEFTGIQRRQKNRQKEALLCMKHTVAALNSLPQDEMITTR